MANSAGICLSWKAEIMRAQHDMDSHSKKMALYQTTATIGPSTTAYTATGEVSSANYSAGGGIVTNGTTSLSGPTAIWTPAANIAWTNVTFTTDCSLLYNTSSANRAIAAFTFGSQSVSAGNFTLTMPTNDSTNALIRIA